jgi:hypothetical protein
MHKHTRITPLTFTCGLSQLKYMEAQAANSENAIKDMEERMVSASTVFTCEVFAHDPV